LQVIKIVFTKNIESIGATGHIRDITCVNISMLFIVKKLQILKYNAGFKKVI